MPGEPAALPPPPEAYGYPAPPPPVSFESIIAPPDPPAPLAGLEAPPQPAPPPVSFENIIPVPAEPGPLAGLDTPPPPPPPDTIDDGGGAEPVILDLSGKGIAIRQLTSSDMFFDMTGAGYKNRTAWAGAGSGVLFVDMTGAGRSSQANQIEFTKWDPAATGDLQALAGVFDTNHDGKLDAGDAAFAKFYVQRVNADGTQTVLSLAQLGIASIDLTGNAVAQAFADGSSIDSETTFTYAGGGTGTVASVTLATSAANRIVDTAGALNADGSTTKTNAVQNPDGSAAYTATTTDGMNSLGRVRRMGPTASRGRRIMATRWRLSEAGQAATLMVFGQRSPRALSQSKMRLSGGNELIMARPSGEISIMTNRIRMFFRLFFLQSFLICFAQGSANADRLKVPAVHYSMPAVHYTEDDFAFIAHTFDVIAEAVDVERGSQGELNYMWKGKKRRFSYQIEKMKIIKLLKSDKLTEGKEYVFAIVDGCELECFFVNKKLIKTLNIVWRDKLINNDYSNSTGIYMYPSKNLEFSEIEKRINNSMRRNGIKFDYVFIERRFFPYKNLFNGLTFNTSTYMLKGVESVLKKGDH